MTKSNLIFTFFVVAILGSLIFSFLDEGKETGEIANGDVLDCEGGARYYRNCTVKIIGKDAIENVYMPAGKAGQKVTLFVYIRPITRTKYYSLPP